MKKVFILCLFGLLMLSACSSPPEDRYEPLILDETGSLTPHERALFASAPYPKGRECSSQQKTPYSRAVRQIS